MNLRFLTAIIDVFSTLRFCLAVYFVSNSLFDRVLRDFLTAENPIFAIIP